MNFIYVLFISSGKYISVKGDEDGCERKRKKKKRRPEKCEDTKKNGLKKRKAKGLKLSVFIVSNIQFEMFNPKLIQNLILLFLVRLFSRTLNGGFMNIFI